MPTIGGVSIGWDETSPSDSASASLGDDEMRSIKTSVRQGLAAEHVWSSGGGANTGAHVLGSARPFFGLQSTVSSSGSDGRLMQASDTSRIFGVGSGGTTYLGGPLGLSIGTTAGFTFPQRHLWVQEMGAGITHSSGSTLVTIPSSGFSGVPFWQIQSVQTSVAPTNVTFVVFPIDGSTAVVTAIAPQASTVAPNQPFQWFSWGTRVL